MTTHNDDWQDLARTWTETGSEPPIDAGLIASVQRRDRLGRLNFLAEIVIALAALGFLGWAVVVWRIEGVVAVATFGFIVFALLMTLWLRLRTPDCLTDTPVAALRTAASQARSGRGWAWAGLAICAASLVYLAVMVAVLPRSGTFRIMASGAGGLFILFWVVLCVRHIRTSGRRLAACSQALADMEEKDESA